MGTVFLYLPNLIGYLRIVLALYAFVFFATQPVRFALLYSLSALLDSVDGYTARLLNQGTKFGTVLDMATDRASTFCLLILLSSLDPSLCQMMQLIGALDLTSHYAQMYAAACLGSHNHKTGKVLHGAPALLKLYYESKSVLFGFCAGEQLFLLSLLFLVNGVDYSCKNVNVVTVIYYAAAPAFSAKQFMNLLQLVHASKVLASTDINKKHA